MRQEDITPAQSLEAFTHFMAQHNYHQGNFLNSGLKYFANDTTGILFLNKNVPEHKLKTHLRDAANKWPLPFTPVFIKDAKTYFRSASFNKDLKRDVRFQDSLRNYKPEQKRKMIHFTPAEHLARQQQGTVNYYQPETDHLEEKLVAYKFSDVLQQPTSNHPFAKERYSTKIFLPVEEYTILHPKTN